LVSQSSGKPTAVHAVHARAPLCRTTAPASFSSSPTATTRGDQRGVLSSPQRVRRPSHPSSSPSSSSPPFFAGQGEKGEDVGTSGGGGGQHTQTWGAWHHKTRQLWVRRWGGVTAAAARCCCCCCCRRRQRSQRHAAAAGVKLRGGMSEQVLVAVAAGLVLSELAALRCRSASWQRRSQLRTGGAASGDWQGSALQASQPQGRSLVLVLVPPREVSAARASTTSTCVLTQHSTQLRNQAPARSTVVLAGPAHSWQVAAPC